MEININTGSLSSSELKICLQKIKHEDSDFAIFTKLSLQARVSQTF